LWKKGGGAGGAGVVVVGGNVHRWSLSALLQSSHSCKRMRVSLTREVHPSQVPKTRGVKLEGERRMGWPESLLALVLR